MTRLTLPSPIAAYLETGAGDAEKSAACFTPDAIVRDENRVHEGRDAIREWKAATAEKYQYTAEPITVAEENGKTIVTCRVSGTFPGSPIDLRYSFVVEGELISSLEIVA